MKKIYIYAHSCKLRFLDASRVRSYFSHNNYKIVNKPKDADIIFFIGCAAIDYITDEALHMVKEFQKYDAELIVAGCLPNIEKEKLADIFAGRTIDTKDLDKDPDKMDELFPENRIKFREIDDANISFQNLNEGKLAEAIKKIFRNMRWIENTYARIKGHVLKNIMGEHSFFYNVLIDEPMYRMRISWGCNCNCSYCGIKKAIGSHKSKPLEQVIEEFRNGLNKGYKHFMMNADDIGAYGTDINSSFTELLDKMTNIPGEYKISIANLSPRWLIKYIDDLEEIFKRQKIIRLGVPIQSGSSRILKLMNRFHDTEKIKEVLIRLKTAFPMLSLHTHIIVGFPTETEEEFEQTLSFINKCNLSAGQVNIFSRKAGAEAERIEPKIPQDEIYKRMKYAKEFLKKAGYNVTYKSKGNIFLFDKMDSYIQH
ncbi:2-methylthioadenine synthetase [Thermoplasmatales archaeon SCGC AB-540-F20]|nr:2-methylthioadenine synthetase [Thermoplasmatales archaeon SCGC AB-540-F20]